MARCRLAFDEAVKGLALATGKLKG